MLNLASVVLAAALASTAPDLQDVRAIAFDGDDARTNLQAALQETLPDVAQTSREKADVVIGWGAFFRASASDVTVRWDSTTPPELLAELPPVVVDAPADVSHDPPPIIIDWLELPASDVPASSPSAIFSWTATLYRLACPSETSGVPPTRPIDGECPRGLFVRVKMGELSGTAVDGESAARAFAAALHQAIWTPAER